MNALAFSGGNFLFSKIDKSGVDEERERYGRAMEQTQVTQAEYSQKRTEQIDWFNEEFRRQGYAVSTFQDVNAAIREYSRDPGQTLDKLPLETTLPVFLHTI